MTRPGEKKILVGQTSEEARADQMVTVLQQRNPGAVVRKRAKKPEAD